MVKPDRRSSSVPGSRPVRPRRRAGSRLRVEPLEERLLLAPVFTGHVPHDFTDADVIMLPDPGGIGDVGVPDGAPAGTVSGWDVAAIYLDYDHATGTLSVGIDCAGICGDADGDGHPGIWSMPPQLSGDDVPGLGPLEAFALLIDTDNDFTTSPGGGFAGDFEVVVGINDAQDIAGFSLHRFDGYPLTPQLSSFWKEPLGGPVELYGASSGGPAAAAPDLEFRIPNFRSLGITPAADGSFQFGLMAFLGSFADGGFGEEFVQASAVTVPAASLGDLVWEDADADGVQDPGEAGLPGVTVNLLDGAGQVLQTVQTGPDGSYHFQPLDAGSYAVQFLPPPGFLFSPAHQASDDSDSDADPSSGRTAPVSLATGQKLLSLDAGLYQLGSIGDRVWQDADGDGVQDASEDGLADVTVRLFDGTGSSLLATAVTNATGGYVFMGLPPGQYTVQFVSPPRLTFSPPGQGGNPAADSDAAPATGRTGPVTLTSGLHLRSVDAGLYVPAAALEATKRDRLLRDANHDGLPSPGDTLRYTITITNVSQHDAYDVAFSDSLTDPNLVLLPGSVTVSQGTVVTASAASGTVLVSIGTVPAGGGPVTVRFKARIRRPLAAAAGQVANQGQVSGSNVPAEPTDDPDTPADDDPTLTPVFQPPARLLHPASLAGFVYFDRDDDGLRDDGEWGLANVPITLQGTNDLGESVYLVTTTGSDGSYLFDNLRPGRYTLRETQPVQLTDGRDSVGNLGGRAGNDVLRGIRLSAGDQGTEYNFGERFLRLPYVSKRSFLASSGSGSNSGRLGRSATRTAELTKLTLLTDPQRPLALVVNGTAGSDRIVFRTAGGGRFIAVVANGRRLGRFRTDRVGRLVAFGYGGNDRLMVKGGIRADALLYGGSGNDRLVGGGGNDILAGQDGQDVLRGAAGRDMLVGGLGKDVLVAAGASRRRSASQGDILIGGLTAYENVDQALELIMDEWTAQRAWRTRAANLRRGRSGIPPLNSATVISDGAADRIMNHTTAADLLFRDQWDRLGRSK